MSSTSWKDPSNWVTCTVLTDDNRFEPAKKAGDKIELGKYYALAFAADGVVSIDEETTE